jgi:hypothetical protein
VFFVIIAAVYSVGQYFILEFVKHRSIEIRAKDVHLRFIHLIIKVAQYFLVAVLIFVVLEILLTSSYHTLTLTTVTAISYILTIGMLTLFAQRFFSWYKSNRSSVVVLLFALSFAINAFALVTISVNELILMLEKEPLRTPQSEVIFPSDVFEPGSFLANLFDTYQYAYTISFIILLAGTAILLHHYSGKIGKIKFWTIIFLPVLYRVGSELENFGLITLTTDAEFFYYYLFSSLNSAAGGILFGIAFWTVAKTMRPDSPVKQYLLIAAYGFVLQFISNQITLTAASYPPFGLATVIPLALSSYMIFLGVYSTAVSISQDNRLRQSIKRIATKDRDLLSSIGTAQMEQEIQRTVKGLQDVVEEKEKEMEEQTGIEANMGEGEMKEYLEQVMQEVGKAKKPSADT